MINAFAKSRRMAWFGGAALGVAAGAGAWLLLAKEEASLFNRILLVILAAFVGANIAVYLARMIAAREYQSRLLLLYEQLDPQAFLKAVEPLQKAALDQSSKCNLLVHMANGWLYAGNTEKALEILDGISLPDKALSARGLVLSNQAACWLAQGNADKAQFCMDQLKTLLASKECDKAFADKARHGLAYLQICMDLRRGKRVERAVLEKDFSTSRSPFHRLDVQYRIALSARKAGDKACFEQAREYVLQHGAKTVFPSLLNA